MYKKFLHYSQALLEKLKQKKEDTHAVETQKAFQKYQASQQEEKRNDVLHISILSVFKILGVLTGTYMLWQISDILTSLLFAIFLALVLSSFIKFLESKKIPSPLSIILAFVCVFVFLGILVSSIIPALIDQSIALGNWALDHARMIYSGDFSRLPAFAQPFGGRLQEGLQIIDEYLKSLQTDENTQAGLFQLITENISRLKPWQESLTSAIASVFSFLANFFIILLLTFFILLEREQIISFLLKFFSPELKTYITAKGEQVQEKIGQWVHGQMILFLFMGGITWIFFSILGVEYALTVGFIAGVAEFIPYIGPVLTLLIGLPLAFGEGFEIGLIAMVFFGIMQFVEGNILIPIVMEKAVGVSAVVTLLAMLIGFHFLDIPGAIMAIPLAAIIGIFLQDLEYKPKK